jgi:hypothetical protein
MGPVARVLKLGELAGRLAAPAAFVRVAVWAFTVGAGLVGFPAKVVLDPAGIPVIVVAALVPAVWPRTRLVSLYLFAIVVGWIVSTSVYGAAISPWRLLPLAALLYLAHTTAALAAVLPYDAVVSPGVIGPWFLRAFGVLVASTALGLLAYFGRDLAGGHAFIGASLAGAALVCVMAWIFTRLARDRR